MKKEAGLYPVFALLVVGACGKKTPPPAPAPAPAPVAAAPASTVDRDAEERARREAEARRLAEEAARNRATLEARVHFDYDQFNLTGAAQSVLQSKLPVLRADPSIRLRIEGHADERGSLEYNLALGMRRARSARDYLVGFGLDPAAFTVDSMGEDRPLDAGHTEAAWSKNRRAEFVIVAGALVGIR